MTKQIEPWHIGPAKKKPAVTASLKAEVEIKAQALIKNSLNPKYVLPSRKYHAPDGEGGRVGI